MKKEDKATVIAQIAETIKSYSGFYLVETAGLDAEKTSAFRRACFGADVKLMVVKNTLLHKALESLEGDYSELYPALKGSTSLMCTNVGNAPAKLGRDRLHGRRPARCTCCYQEQERTYRRCCGSAPVASQERYQRSYFRRQQAPWYPRDTFQEGSLNYHHSINRKKQQIKLY